MNTSLTPLPAWVARANAAQAEADAPYSAKTRRAIAKYAEATCIEAHRMHSVDGEGGNTVGFYLGLTTRQADAAINAGEEIALAKQARAAAIEEARRMDVYSKKEEASKKRIAARTA